MNDRRGFRLIPDDVLFFRDGKPSTQGQDHALRSLFPPHPTTLYGAVRSHLLRSAGVELDGLHAGNWASRVKGLALELGTWGGFGSLALRGPWLVRGEAEVLLPAPLDLAIVDDKKALGEEARKVGEVGRYRPVDSPSEGSWSHPFRLLSPCKLQGGEWSEWNVGPDAEEPVPARGWYLTSTGLAAWSRGGVPAPEDLVHETALWTGEPRTGVGLEPDQRSSREGHLYTFDFIRLRQGISLGFEARGTSLAPEGTLRLGGEGRTACLEAGPLLPPAPTWASPPERLVLSLATPALSAASSSSGAPGLSARGLLGSASTLAAVVPGFLLAGGWDLARGEPKPLRRLVPAGSVFLLDPRGTDLSSLWGANLSEDGGERLSQQGFGLALLGASL